MNMVAMRERNKIGRESEVGEGLDVEKEEKQ